MNRYILFEQRLFYLLVILGIGILGLLFFSSDTISQRDSEIQHQQLAQVEQRAQQRVAAALNTQQEQTLALALSAARAVRINTASGRIIERSSIVALERLAKETGDLTRFKQIRFRLIDSSGTVLYRTGSKRPTRFSADESLYRNLLDYPRRLESVEVDETLRFVAIEPLYKGNQCIGFLEASTAFDTLVRSLKTLDAEAVVVIDKRFRNSLRNPRSTYFLGDYNIVNARINTPQLLRDIERHDIESLLGISHYLESGGVRVNISDLYGDRQRAVSSSYKLLGEYLLIARRVKAYDHTDVAAVIYAVRRHGFELEGLTALYDTKLMLLSGLTLMVLLLLGGVVLRRIFIDKMRRNMIFDFKTQLPNKARLRELIAVDPDAPRMLIVININNFSSINIIYGFEAGDQILFAVGKRLKRACNCSEVFHLDADEFALLYEGEHEPIPMIKKLQRHFYENPLTYGAFSINLTFSYGVALNDMHLFRNASFALKVAKTLGSNRYHIYDHSADRLDKKAREAVIAESRTLYDALNHDRIVPYFQGIRDNVARKITKYETLTRVMIGDTPHSLSDFSDALKATGMLPQITKVIIDKSFAAMQHKPFTFSINISEEDLNQNYLPDYLRDKLLDYDIRPDRVIIEILEGVSSGVKKAHTQQFKNFKKMGMKLAIDDFGAEYSNYERVLELDIDFLKIDAKYIKDIDVNPKSYEITRSIVFFTKNSGLQCVAEYVATEEIQAVVEELGIDFSQGYLFSKPNPTI